MEVKLHRWAIGLAFTTVLAWAGEASAQTAAPRSLWNFLGIPQGFNKVYDARSNSNGNFPGLERQPPLKAIGDPANLQSANPAIKTAAQIKQEEDLAKQKIKALKYLATVGCGCYPGVKEALMAALDDCTERVRFQAAQSIAEAAAMHCGVCGKCCCDEEMTKKLAEIAYEKNDKGCYVECSSRVREAAKEAMRACCPGGPPLETVPTPLPQPEQPGEVTTPGGETTQGGETTPGQPLQIPSPPPPTPAPPMTQKNASPRSPLLKSAATPSAETAARIAENTKHFQQATSPKPAARVAVANQGNRGYTTTAAKPQGRIVVAQRGVNRTRQPVAVTRPQQAPAMSTKVSLPQPPASSGDDAAPDAVFISDSSAPAAAPPRRLDEPKASSTSRALIVVAPPRQLQKVPSEPASKETAATATASRTIGPKVFRAQRVSTQGQTVTRQAPLAERLAENREPAAAPQAPARRVSVKGAIIDVNSRDDLVRIIFSGANQPRVGELVKVYHTFLLGTECVGAVEVVRIRGGEIVARPVGNLSVKKLFKGDQAFFQAELPAAADELSPAVESDHVLARATSEIKQR